MPWPSDLDPDDELYAIISDNIQRPNAPPKMPSHWSPAAFTTALTLCALGLDSSLM